VARTPRECGKNREIRVVLIGAARWDRDGGSYFKKLLFAVNERIDVVGRELEAVTVRDGIGRARFHAITAEDASRVSMLYTLA